MFVVLIQNSHYLISAKYEIENNHKNCTFHRNIHMVLLITEMFYLYFSFPFSTSQTLTVCQH